MNDIIWRAIKRAQVPAVKEPVSLTLEDNKRPDGTTLLPWAKGKPLTWDVTVPDTYADCRVTHRWHGVHSRGGSSSNGTTQDCQVFQAGKHINVLPHCHRNSRHMAIELVQGIGRRTTVITQDTREAVFLFQRLSIALQRELRSHSSTQWTPNKKSLQPLFNILLIFTPAALCWWAKNNINKTSRSHLAAEF